MHCRSLSFAAVTLIACFGESGLHQCLADERQPQLTIVHGVGIPPRAVTSVCFSPDGKTIASAGGGKAKLWEASTGKEMRTLDADGADAICFGPDGKSLACGGSDYRITLYNIADGKLLAAFQDLDAGQVLSLAFRADGKVFASGHHAWTGRVWDIKTAKVHTVLKGPKAAIKSVSFSPDGKTVAGGSHDGTRIWNADTGKELFFLKADGGINAVSFHPAGKLLAAGGEDWTATLWNAENGKKHGTIGDGRSGPIFTLGFSPDGKTLACAGSSDTPKPTNSKLALWDVESGKIVATINCGPAAIHSIQFSPSGKQIVAGDSDGNIKLWSTEAEK